MELYKPIKTCLGFGGWSPDIQLCSYGCRDDGRNYKARRKISTLQLINSSSDWAGCSSRSSTEGVLWLLKQIIQLVNWSFDKSATTGSKICTSLKTNLVSQVLDGHDLSGKDGGFRELWRHFQDYSTSYGYMHKNEMSLDVVSEGSASFSLITKNFSDSKWTNDPPSLHHFYMA